MTKLGEEVGRKLGHTPTCGGCSGEENTRVWACGLFSAWRFFLRWVDRPEVIPKVGLLAGNSVVEEFFQQQR